MTFLEHSPNERTKFSLVLFAALFIFIGDGLAAPQVGHSPADIFRSARPSVVLVVAGDEKGQPTVQGSGFIIGQDRIVTNHHVVAGTSVALIIFSDGGSSPVTSVIADSSTKDLIILSATTGQRPSLTLGDELMLQQGDPVYAIGAPQGLELTLTNGIVSSFRNIDDQFLIQSTAAIGHGSSGGPLFDREGKVVGVTSSLLSDTPGIYFSVGIGDLKRLLRSPQLLILSFSEWAKENVAKPASTGSETPSESPAVGQIEKLLQDKKFEEARSALATLADSEPGSQAVHRLTGELDERTGDPSGAIQELGAALEKDPSDAIANFYYAIALFEVRRFNDALEHEVKSNQLAPTASDEPLLSLLYYSVRNYQQAEVMARKALGSDPSNETALAVLAGIAFHGLSSQQDNWADYVQKLSVTNPDNFWVHISEGYNALKQNQTDKAVADFTAAEKDDFPDPVPYLGLTYIYIQSSDFGKANDQIKTGLDEVPDDLQLLAQGIFVSLVERDNTEAERRFKLLDASYPGTREALFSGCLYYYGTGQAANAIPICARLIQQFPNDCNAYSDYGWVALDANQFSVALQEFSAAYKLAAPNWSQLTSTQAIDLYWGFTIADYYSGDKKEAHKLLEIIRKSYPSAATVTGLQQLPLLWSATTMTRIEGILREFPK